ncbi:Transmembrane protein [Orchesella cincta]|uniref:Transmembrane protein n=1 Tax=Orchesella cincta TaxID=48709 RepID=A0A1D2MG60_ORCCI|nr:Transmembrane protein [Orchesella cincta]
MDLDTGTNIKSAVKEFDNLSEKFKNLKNLHKYYVQTLDEAAVLQAKCVKELNHHRSHLGKIKTSIKKYGRKPELKEVVEKLEQKLIRRKSALLEMDQSLPKKIGLYLWLILGNVNVSIFNEEEKCNYKDEYEKFKLITNGIGLLMSIANIFKNLTALDLLFKVLLVWYYCTVTIRESILKVNGSKIQGWWRMHHFLSMVLSGVLLIWPNNSVYYSFRMQFMWFNVYTSLVQFLQCWYQRGCLYRLKALGERHNMDITIEGFHSWMWRGLSFLIPFLFISYFFQLYNSYVLYQLSYDSKATWQVPVLSALFLVVSLGNIIIIVAVLRNKLNSSTFTKLLGRDRPCQT